MLRPAALISIAALSLVASPARPSRDSDEEAFAGVIAAREADRATARLRPELRAKWVNHLRAKGLDEASERATTARLQEEFFAAIDEWGRAVETCEPDGVNRRWLSRLLKAFTREDVIKQKDDVTRVLGALAADRQAECAASAQERALKAERELNAFVADRLATELAFFDALEPGSVRASTRLKLARLEKATRAQRPLADRSVNLASIRLKTAAAQTNPDLVDQLENDPAFQKPFELKRALAQLNGLDRTQGPKSTKPKLNLSPNLAVLAAKPAPVPVKAPSKLRPDPEDLPKKTTTSETPAETLPTPWLLQ